MTDRKTKDQEQRTNVQRAFETLKELVDHAGDKRHHQALALLRPSLYGLKKGRRAGPFKSERFMEAVRTRKVISELDVFKEFKVDRAGVKRLIRDYRRRHPLGENGFDPGTIILDEQRGVYRLQQ